MLKLAKPGIGKSQWIVGIATRTSNKLASPVAKTIAAWLELASLVFTRSIRPLLALLETNTLPLHDIEEITKFLNARGFQDADEMAHDAVEDGEPIVETICFHEIAEDLFCPIHDATWVEEAAEDGDHEIGDHVKRLLATGAEPEDLAIFARYMQRRFASDLGRILDGINMYTSPERPFEDFGVFALVDGKPTAQITDLEEGLGFWDLDSEMELSLSVAKALEEDDERDDED